MMRTFLFLQGPIGPFFKLLSHKLEAMDCVTLKINFNTGDRFFWNGDNAIDFKYNIEKWADYVRDIAKLRKVTDLVVYGDCRPIHKIAIEALKGEDINIHVFEEGYFRPNWITYERNGVNAYSNLPTDPEFYQSWEEVSYTEPKRFKTSIYQLAIYTMEYYLASLKGMYGEFKNYDHHFEISPHVTMSLWIPKIIFGSFRKYIAGLRQKEIVKSDYFFVPLQLCRDYQIKEHSEFHDVADFSRKVIASFAKKADKKYQLVFKAHPLDNNPFKLEKVIKDEAEKHKIVDRVVFLDGGRLPTIIDNAEGVIVVNSTTGLSAIHHGKPTLVLGRAIYNFEGLTNQTSLDKFWSEQQIPDRELYNKFRNYVITKTQLNGGFYTKDALATLIPQAAKMLLKPSSEFRNSARA